MSHQTYARSYMPEITQPPQKKSPLNIVKGIIKPEILVWVLLVVAIIIPILVSFSKPEGIAWLFQTKDFAPADLGDVSIALAPLFALALAIERIIETLFDMFEQSFTEIAKLSSGGKEVLQWFNEELDRAWEAAREIAQKLGNEVDEDNAILMKKLEEAENRIAKATERIFGLKNDPMYVSTKRVLSIWLGLLLGLIVATMSDKGIFELLQIGVPRFLDMIVTGFVIGAGSGPMHSLVGILQGAKNTLDRIGDLSSMGSIRDEIASLREELANR